MSHASALTTTPLRPLLLLLRLLRPLNEARPTVVSTTPTILPTF